MAPKSSTALFGLMASVMMPNVALVAATPPDLTFLCDQAPEVCSNMCWSIRCANPTFSQLLTFDHPDRATLDKRVLNACGKVTGKDIDRCTILEETGPGPRNSSCSMYPFANTNAAGDGYQAVSRCVPESEGKYQHTRITTLHRQFAKAGKTSFVINFGNPGAARYCNNDPCFNDGHEWQHRADVGLAGASKEERLFRYYQTKTGIVVASMDEVALQTTFTREVSPAENLNPSFKTWVEQAEVSSGEKITMVVDTIEKELPQTYFHNGAHKFGAN
ncbi:hypothetical protein E4U55_006457 [Claviceps digitariae]|nr:hypothetical protein E4U55_006457 [Claviceps digitariae]